MPAGKIRKTLLEQEAVAKCPAILEIGCGTGDFTLLLAQKYYSSEITAVDMDEKALSILKDKMGQNKLRNIVLQQASATQLPFTDRSFDVVYSSLLFCNLSYDEKLKTIEEAKRVLKSTGQFLIADWSKPQTIIGKIGFIIMQWVGGKANTEDMKKGMLPYYLLDAGFVVKEFNNINTFFGTISYYQATKTK